MTILLSIYLVTTFMVCFMTIMTSNTHSYPNQEDWARVVSLTLIWPLIVLKWIYTQIISLKNGPPEFFKKVWHDAASRLL